MSPGAVYQYRIGEISIEDLALLSELEPIRPVTCMMLTGRPQLVIPASVESRRRIRIVGQGGDGCRILSLRWVYTHMIEEYAQHNGHADLLRQRIDGATGS